MAWASFDEELAKGTDVLVEPDVELGAIKPMNAVNNGPRIQNAGTMPRAGYAEYKAGRFPLARLHDSINCVPGGAHCADISAVFPNFDADENDPKNYDFLFTDKYIENILRTGTKIYYRLGQTIEHGPKKYGIHPPKDFAKWARICEHVIRHYNEGWADGSRYGIEYWEIWNEPDLRSSKPETSSTWSGTPEQYFSLYETTAKHLKKCFPNLKIGGPAYSGVIGWGDRFLDHVKKTGSPMDFFSWHIYHQQAGMIADACVKTREMLDRHGFKDVPSHLNEWNFVKGFSYDWEYTLSAESGKDNLRGGGCVAATLSACQDAPVDLLMYYDARPGTLMNGLFDLHSSLPLKAYYALYSWAKLVDRGTQVKTSFARNPKSTYGNDVEFRATAAKGKDGALAVFVSRFDNDNNKTWTRPLTIRVAGRSLAGARCHLTDADRTHTEIPLEVAEDGSATIRMLPTSWFLIEL